MTKLARLAVIFGLLLPRLLSADEPLTTEQRHQVESVWWWWMTRELPSCQSWLEMAEEGVLDRDSVAFNCRNDVAWHLARKLTALDVLPSEAVIELSFHTRRVRSELLALEDTTAFDSWADSLANGDMSAKLEPTEFQNKLEAAAFDDQGNLLPDAERKAALDQVWRERVKEYFDTYPDGDPLLD